MGMAPRPDLRQAFATCHKSRGTCRKSRALLPCRDAVGKVPRYAEFAQKPNINMGRMSRLRYSSLLIRHTTAFHRLSRQHPVVAANFIRVSNARLAAMLGSRIASPNQAEICHC